MKIIGAVLIVVGLTWAVFGFQMTTTVEGGGQRYGSGEFSINVPRITVNNAGLLQERQNHLIMAGFTILAGILLFGFGSVQKSNSSTGDQVRKDKWDHLVKYDANVQGAIKMLESSGSNAVNELRKAYFAMGDQADLMSLAQKISADMAAVEVVNLNPVNELIAAIYTKDVTRVKSLINAGVNVDAKNDYKVTPLRIARNCNDQVMIDLLIKAGAKIG